MQKDQEAERTARSVESPQPAVAASRPDLDEPPAPPKPPAPPPDPHIEALNARWKEFEAQDYEGQIALFVKTLDEAELMDHEIAFDMLNTIYYKSVEHNERNRFDALVAALRERLPDVYARDASYYLQWRTMNALATGRVDAIPALANELAQTAGRDIDTFNNVVDQLAYHSQLSTLVEAMRIAWPLVRTSRDIVPWGISEFAERAVSNAIFDFLEHNAAPNAADPALRERLEFYTEIDPERLSSYMALLTGQAERHWTLSDFAFKRSRRRSHEDFDEEDDVDQPPDEGAQNLLDLSVEFLGYLRREEGVPYTKGELGREHIRQYLLDRHAGELEPRPSMLEAALRPKPRKPPRPPRPPDHVLCPDRSTLDRYLAGLLDFINPQRYKAAATLELVPAWLRFLESRQLIDAQQQAKTLRELHGLDTGLLKVWEHYPADPALQQGMKRWWENAELPA